MRLARVCSGVLLLACTKQDPAPNPGESPVASAVSASAASAPPQPSAAAEDASCFSPAKSMEYAKPHRSAEAPFSECAAGIFSHCPPDDAYCSIALNVARTKEARATGKQLCCYGK